MQAVLFLRAHLFAAIWLVAIAIVQANGEQEQEASKEIPMIVTFVNEMPSGTLELFWENNASGDRKTEGTIPPRGGFLEVNTFVGHEFSYDLNGKRHYITPPEPNAKGQQFAVLAGDSDGIFVRCKLERQIDHSTPGLYNPYLELIIKPYWAPRGASRFLELVRKNYYDGVVVNRVVPQFLTQFGIAEDYETRMEWEKKPILDDFPDVGFDEGYISFAGNGPDSRTTEIFIVMPGTSREQMDAFGTNSWEVPFGLVGLGGVDMGSILTELYSGYGDMPPWGDGPDSERIYDTDGYKYLAQNFPKLDYIDRCYIAAEEYEDYIEL